MPTPSPRLVINPAARCEAQWVDGVIDAEALRLAAARAGVPLMIEDGTPMWRCYSVPQLRDRVYLADNLFRVLRREGVAPDRLEEAARYLRACEAELTQRLDHDARAARRAA